MLQIKMADFEPSVDLVNLSKAHLVFLRDVDNIPRLHDDDVIRNAVRRYETCWLPMIAKNMTMDLHPPMDIHWVWHTHMLAPRSYASDCEKLVGCVPDHNLPMPLDQRHVGETLKRTETLWKSLYPEEEFNIELAQGIPKDKLAYTSVLSYDVIAASARQRSFYYHVSLPHYTDTKFLTTALKRYIKFMHLKKSNRDVFVGKTVI